MDKRLSRDLLSNLPLGIIHTILAKIPIRDAVKTSMLSRQWRYNWVTLPHLTFDAKSWSPGNEPKDFITPLLLLHQGPIIKFKLKVPFAEIFRNVDHWLIFLSRNNVRFLILKYLLDDFSLMHSNLYSCQHSVTHLELCRCELPPPPSTFNGFLSLRCLVLDYALVSSKTLQTLLGDQTLLEELTLQGCVSDPAFHEGFPPEDYVGDYDLKIHAPNLKILRLRGKCFKSICLNAPLLREMSVDFVTNLAPQKSSVCTYTEFLGGLSSLEELKGSFNFFKYLSIGLDSSDASLEFPHLRLIELCPNAFHDIKVQSVVARLSKNAPNLHKIRFKFAYSRGTQLRLGDLSFYSEWLSNFTFERLKVIEICPSGGGRNMMKLIKWLLENSPVLETLIYGSRYQTDSQLLEQTSKLMGFPRASPNAKILLGMR